MKKMFMAAAAATAFISTAAWATVTFDPNTGTGFVGKGDVQLAFGWNNAAMQARHLAVTFAVDQSASYDVTCEWTTVTGGKESKTITHDVTIHKNVSSSASVDSTSRKTGQYTGWFLNGYTQNFNSLTIPSVGDPCPQGGGNTDNDPPGNDAVVTAVSDVVGGAGTLSAIYNSDSRVIYTF